MEKSKWYLIGFYIIFGFDCGIEFGFITRFILALTKEINIFSFMLLIPLLALLVIIILDSIFIAHYNKGLKEYSTSPTKYTNAFLYVKKHTRRSMWNFDLVIQFGAGVFFCIIFIGIPMMVMMSIGWSDMKDKLKRTNCKNEHVTWNQSNVIVNKETIK
jgi:uncharacterized membrane protein